MTCSPRPTVAVAYHSGNGHTEVLAAAVARGAGPDTVLVPVHAMTETHWTELDRADAIVFGAPTYLGGASSAFHAFAEASSGRYRAQAWQDKLAAGFTSSAARAGDKSATLAYLALFAAQHGMHWINLGRKPGFGDNDMNRLGFWLGATAACPIGTGPEDVHKADIATAEHLGARVAGQAAIFTAGRAAVKI
jgi:multimeric flavodoxin WrbA